jgi:hypothetical protein
MRKLIDAQYEELDRLVNATIAELVFLRHHAGDNEIESAEGCQMTAGHNIERIGEILEDGTEDA